MFLLRDCIISRQLAPGEGFVSSPFLRLVFTCDGVIVEVVIKSVERYDLVKIKPAESEAEHRFCLWLRRLRSSENCNESEAEAEE